MAATVRSPSVAGFPRTSIRRPISIPVVVLSSLVMIVLAPVVVPFLLVVDLVKRYPGGRLGRAWLLSAAILTTEAVGVIAAAALWVWYLGGRRAQNWMDCCHRLEFWWARTHMKSLGRFAGITLLTENPEALAPGNAIIVSRHASHIDAIAPLLALEQAGQLPRYTLKQDLRWAPFMDIIGGRVPTVWIDRAPQADSPMYAAIEALGAGLDETSSAVIFPEGTFFTPARHDRAVRRLAQTRPDLTKKAARLRYLLPPRPAGTLALMRGAPDADVVILANVGVEDTDTVRKILATIPQKRTLRVKATRYSRAHVPRDQDELTEWLLDRWLEVDAWIHEHLTNGSVHE